MKLRTIIFCIIFLLVFTVQAQGHEEDIWEFWENINAQTRNAGIPLKGAIIHNPNPLVVTTLLEAGADINIPTVNADSLLMAAAQHNTNPSVISALLEAGANVNARSAADRSSLHIAAAYNPNPEIITMLLSAGADINVEAQYGSERSTPLIESFRNENPSVILRLIDSGADVNIPDEWGSTPLMKAIQYNPYPQRIFISDNGELPPHDYIGPEIITVLIEALLEAGADVNAQEIYGGKTAWDLIQYEEKLYNTDVYWKLERLSRDSD